MIGRKDDLRKAIHIMDKQVNETASRFPDGNKNHPVEKWKALKGKLDRTLNYIPDWLEECSKEKPYSNKMRRSPNARTEETSWKLLIYRY